jgi:hypothetical protein
VRDNRAASIVREETTETHIGTGQKVTGAGANSGNSKAPPVSGNMGWSRTACG